MKKITSLILALVLAFSLVSLSACGDKATDDKNSDSADDKVITVQTKNCLGTACYRCQMSCPAKVYQYNKLQLVDN